MFCLIIITAFLRSDVDAGTIEQHSRYGLIYFYEDGCPYCERQTPVLQRYLRDYPMAVLKVEIRHRPDLTARFNITMVPTIILVQKGSASRLLISKGAIGYQKLKYRISDGIKYLEKQRRQKQIVGWSVTP